MKSTVRLPTSHSSPFTGLLSHILSLKSFRKKIKINSHIPLGKNGHIHGLEFSGFPPILVLCAISSDTGFEETPGHLLLAIQLMNMP